MGSKFSLEAVLSLTDNLTKQYKQTTNKVTALNTSMNRSFTAANTRINNMAKGLAVGVAAGAGAAAAGIGVLVREASKIEDATARFTPLMGSVERANDLVDALNTTAATTPFQFENIADVANSILPAMNGDIEKTIQSFRMLGDTAGGSAEKLNTISSVFTRAMLKNKVEVGDLNMLVSAGIPIYGELAKQMGVTVEEMSAMVSTGKVTGKQLEATFQTMTAEGGIFYNGMQIASETLTGKISTMKDNFALTAAELGKAFLPQIKRAADLIIGLAGQVREWAIANKDLIAQKIEDTINDIVTGVKNFIPQAKKFLENIKGIVDTFNRWKPIIKTVLIFLTAYIVAVKGYMAIQFAKAVFAAVKAFMMLAKAQGVLNALMAANPIGLIVLGIAALIAIIVLLVKHWDKVKAAMVSAWQAIKQFFSTNKELFIAFLGPAGILLNVIISIFESWNDIKSAFQDGGFLKGILAIGKAIWDGLVAPIKEFFGIVQSIVPFGAQARERREGRQENREERRDERTARQQAKTEARRESEASSMRNDVFLHAPSGYGMSTDAGGAPSPAVALGGQ